jgi:carboxylesterase
MTPALKRLRCRRRILPPQSSLDSAPFTLGPLDAPVACLLIHGFSGSPIEMRWLGTYLAAHGVRVEGVRLAGHGTEPEALTHLTWHDWLNSASEGFDRLIHGREKVVIVGFSMGGLLGLHLCEAHPDQVGGIVTISSPIYFVDRRIHLIPVVRHVIHWHNVRRPGSNTDPEANMRYNSYRRYPLIAVDHLLDLMRVTRKLIPRIQVPALIMHGVHDHVIDSKSAAYLFKRIGSAQKELVFWKNSGHGVPFDAEREEVWHKVLQFVQAHA